MRVLALAAVLLVAAPLGAAGAQPPPPHAHGPGAHRDLPRHRWHGRQRVCRTVWRHHHRVRRCTYR